MSFLVTDYEFPFLGHGKVNSITDVTSFGNCNVAGFCNDTELRLNANFSVSKENNASYYHSYTARVQYVGEFWDDNRPYPVDYEQDFIGFMADKMYRSIHFIPSNELMHRFSGRKQFTQAFDYCIDVNDEI
mmetsp:Transcript_29409/g.53195  ORF Transcript_29409/g.53195 Transcript_29409/m.53195 type:complete len:131 (-) Transcript_29409:104-496(-)|eukprot:CAMPEP_0202489400 /NCGR_PEP_ID=MMETSP1361-20130828/7137_1 /ASSEMBLY_ACC=CAM_ASM_000849 /TAXON_ID=210615 /ORGANISM="Staurosira complex sp., Strain CCMP2646" /LENGTH=130 /DNA_ID=CAMNT_0049119139 /DNA_START=1649 /DNA_END=2041 /DNA_ORIENTATION=+